MVLRRNAIPEEFCRDDSGFVYCSIEDYGSQSMADAALPRYLSGDAAFTFYTSSVSYTHLDVYKRQAFPRSCTWAPASTFPV